MKILMLCLIITLIAGLFFGTLVSIDAGYVLLSWDVYTLETSLWFFLLILAATTLSMYIVIRASLLLLGSDWRFNEWRKERGRIRARRMTTRGFLALAQGQWRRAERQLRSSAVNSDTPLINYLAAARAAYEQGDTDSTDELLKAASQSTKGSELAVGITQVQLLQSRKQFEQALAVLLRLRGKHPKHAYVLKLLVKTYQELEDWVALNELLPTLKKLARIPAEELTKLEQNVQLQLLERAAHSYGGNQVQSLKDIYSNMPRSARVSQPVVKRYTELLLEQGEERLAEQELRNALSSVWHDDLICLYGRLNGDINKQLLFAEQQLTERPNDPMLLLILGRLALRQENFAKAREFLQTGLRIKGMPELHAEMGKLLMAEGDQVAACEHFQLALGN
ncbi:heme biosynthesis HemY N-terminal domain-containing protein [Bacterioplanoides sp. SCSIO 12839]|uniref:heme biosynthesis HemY N-terminal domain-containing protein n=1 Tax=Bacterioplanoides sp. SCSIO 12839 TaxID=2829569 RepID=UPI002105B914|nr:heme biosynthesis HemY N-terminal domain-containing protein [Bacterioplanoides sp. SCSIO 12839]UTW48244.1 heme biosynthesis protein HemY [Bacterioplanoides sp. SCSIO 12839]